MKGGLDTDKMLGKQQQQQNPYLGLLLHPGDSHRSVKDYAVYVHSENLGALPLVTRKVPVTNT